MKLENPFASWGLLIIFLIVERFYSVWCFPFMDKYLCSIDPDLKLFLRFAGYPFLWEEYQSKSFFHVLRSRGFYDVKTGNFQHPI